MSGYGPLPAAVTEPDARAGYQMVVKRVREGVPAVPSHGGVEREVSTKVIVVLVTDVEPAAAATDGAPTNGSAMAETTRPNPTAPSDTLRMALIRSLPVPNENPSSHKAQVFVRARERSIGLPKTLRTMSTIGDSHMHQSVPTALFRRRPGGGKRLRISSQLRTHADPGAGQLHGVQ